MKSMEQQLVTYAKYHRDKRNIATHFIGVPLIVFALAWLLYVPIVTLNNVTVTPALAVIIMVCGYYLSLNFRFGALMSVLFALCYTVAKQCYLNWQFTDMWFYLAGAGLFLLGWVIQFVGHYYEGKKPAFVDDIMGLLIGPLFVTVELLFLIGLQKDLEKQIVEQAGQYR
jgi:uncharacterized membrane protein YGL010W